MQTRRQFIRRFVAAGSAAFSVSGQALIGLGDNPQQRSEQEMPSIVSPIVDTHQHLWDLSRFRLPWQKNEPALAKSFLMSDYLATVSDLPLEKTVYMEVDVEPSQQSHEADYVIDLCQRNDNPMVAAVIGGHPASEGFSEYAIKYSKSPFVKGVRQVLHSPATPAGYCLGAPFIKGVRQLGDVGLSFDLCMRPGELQDAARLAKQCPSTRFIVDHCGNMSVQETDAKLRQSWLEGMQALAALDNVVCKVSGIVVTARDSWEPQDLAPNVLDTIKTFGWDRVMFAGDWPVCTLRSTLPRWIEALRWIVRDFDTADRRKLFHDNAVKFYGLKDKHSK